MLFHLNAARIRRGLRKGGATGREVGLRHGCGPSAEMRGVHRRVRLRRKCGLRQGEKPARRTRAIRRAPLIRAAFRGWVKIDDETLRTEVSSSIPPRPPRKLEWNAGENGEMRSWEAGKWVQKKVFCACWRKALEKMTWRNH